MTELNAPLCGVLPRVPAVLVPLTVLLACAQTAPEPVASSHVSPTGKAEQAANTADTGESGLVVHEWGTFTSFQTGEGVLLGGMHHDDAPLPAFVVRAPTKWGVMPDGTVDEPNQRMETPVIYLHTDRRMKVDVRVAFPFGLMSEWFPEAAELLPKDPAINKVQGGALRWQVEVDPALDHNEAPAVAPDNIWAPSRKVKVPSLRNLAVRDQGADAEQARKPGEVERFLFYRGVGKFELPVTVKTDDDFLTVHNSAKQPVAAAFLLVVDGDKAGFSVVGALGSKAPRKVALPTADRPLSDVVAQAHKALVGALQDSGLFHDEAVALVDTWKDSYFATSGTRLLYMVPQPWTDTLLPLTVTPKPDAVVRSLVGRVDVMPPAQ